MTDTTISRNDNRSTFRVAMENAERNSKLIQALIDASPSNIVVVDEDRTIVFANRAWRQFASRTGFLAAAHGIGKRYPDLFFGIASASSEDMTSLRTALERVIDGEEIEVSVEYQCTALARPRLTLMHAASVPKVGEKGSRWIMVCHDDISASETASNQMERDSERLKHLLTTGNMLLWEAPIGSMCVSHQINQSDNLLGYSQEQWRQEQFWKAKLYPADRERVVAQYSTISEIGEHFRAEYRMLANDGRVVWIEDTVNVVREGARALMMRGVMTDISERKLAESVLFDLSGRLITAQEEERKRIARELHDDVNQRIALIAIELEQVVQRSAGTKAETLQPRLSVIQRKVAEISNEIHRMSYELHPSKLNHLGLIPALRSFCADLSRSRGITIHFEPTAIPNEMSQEIKLCIFRVAQEALQNSAKHSGSQNVDVYLRATDTMVGIRIVDHGNGFAICTEKMNDGLGLTSMKERVRLVGGEFNINSAPGSGTTVSVTVPIFRD